MLAFFPDLNVSLSSKNFPFSLNSYIVSKYSRNSVTIKATPFPLNIYFVLLVTKILFVYN